MRQRTLLVLALAAALSVAAGAGPALAASPSSSMQSSFPGPGASAKQKKLAYSRYCGAEPKRRNARKAKERRACIDAMARLAAGKASSPSAACRGLKPKRSKGRKGSSAAYKRCVKSAVRLKKDQKVAEALEEENDAALDEDDAADEQAEAAEEEAAEAAEGAAEAAETASAAATPVDVAPADEPSAEEPTAEEL